MIAVAIFRISEGDIHLTGWGAFLFGMVLGALSYCGRKK